MTDRINFSGQAAANIAAATAASDVVKYRAELLSLHSALTAATASRRSSALSSNEVAALLQNADTITDTITEDKAALGSDDEALVDALLDKVADARADLAAVRL